MPGVYTPWTAPFVLTASRTCRISGTARTVVDIVCDLTGNGASATCSAAATSAFSFQQLGTDGRYLYFT